MKKGGDTYTFRIDRFTPATLPMARLAEYLTELAALYGNVERVHFKELKPGSARVVSTVESEAAPKVKARLQQVVSEAAPQDVQEHFQNVNKLLAQDNAIGNIKRGKATIIVFPGRKTPVPERVGPFNQATELQGQLVRIGGSDKTAHALLEDGDGKIWSVTMSRSQAKDIAAMLYGPLIRVCGTGRWVRTEGAEWELIEMKLQSWERLATDSTLREAVNQLREIPGSAWAEEQDPHALLRRIRHGDDEVH